MSMSNAQPWLRLSFPAGGVCPPPPVGHRRGTRFTTSAGPVAPHGRCSEPLRGPEAPQGPA